ncbi:MAG TPA: hypothetical protein VI643_05205 [Planctomycetota bacterium]|nr:hypothetical protein [Planctomycetota bacterium]
MKYGLLLALLLGAVGCDAKPGSSDASDPAAKEEPPKKTDPKGGETSLDSGQFVEPPAALVESLGVEAYPDAKVMKSFASFTKEKADSTYRDVVFFTRDHASKVGEFYKSRLKDPKQIGESLRSMDLFVIDGTNSRGEKVRVQAQTVKDITSFHVILVKPK